MKQANKEIVLKPHHGKPYRKRHVSALAISLFLSVLFLLQLGILQGINRPDAQPAPVIPRSHSPVTHISSSYGYSFDVDSNQFVVHATKVDPKGGQVGVLQSEISANDPLVSTTLRPKSGTVDRTEAALQARVEVNPDAFSLKAAVADPANKGRSAAEVAGQLFPVNTDKNFTARVLSTAKDTIGGAAAFKTIYEYTPTFTGGKTYGIVWSGVVHDKAFSVSLQGIVGSASVPPALNDFVSSLSIASDSQVKGASINLLTKKVDSDTTKLDPKYLSDALSPAVVKIYHLVCGALVVNGSTLTNDACTGFSGSGFLVTSNGYIATNGHVVVYSAQDALVDILTTNPSAMSAFLRGIGLSADQVKQVNASPVTLASIISKIYDIPDSQLHFDNQKQLTLVAVGITPPKLDQLTSSTDIARLQHETRDLKIAKIIGYNYAAKDKLTAIADPSKGFSSSDVALIKIDIENAPTIALSKARVMQNQKVFLIGFPGDAENQLTDNSQLDVSVTDGVISSVRQAAGKNGLLYQSDADASHGNSGGPALDESGKAIGLLTYRASGDSSGNAAKSYIRDINDFSDLAGKLHIDINSASSTQLAWEEGLGLYSKNHYSAALRDFSAVQDAYPAHRLAGGYVNASQAAIDAGKNVKQYPMGLLVLGLLLAFSTAAVSVWLIIRHHGHHQLYRAFQPGNNDALDPASEPNPVN